MEKSPNFQQIALILKPYIQLDEFERLKSSDHLVNDLNIDSADLVSIVLEVEQSYDIVIDDPTIENIKTVSDILDVVEPNAIR